MAWSKDSKRILITGNGWKSSLVVYDVLVGEGGPKQKLTWAWTLLASGDEEVDKQQPSTCSVPTSRIGKLFKRCSVEVTEDEASGNNNAYVVAYSMAEFNPTGHLFAVKNVPYRTALVQLISAEGKVVQTLDLMMATKDRERLKKPVHTLFISAFHNGVYAVGLVGGRVALVDAETLDLKKTFTVVS